MTAVITGLSSSELLDYGLGVLEGNGISGTLDYERPAFPHGPSRMRDCAMGAFSYINGHGSSSLYRCRLGRYAQVGEATIVGAPEHPIDWFSNHPFTFTRPEQLPRMYRLPEFARLAPDGSEDTKYTDTVPSDTYIGHEAYVGAGSYVRRGVTIGNGAVVGAGSVVTRDVPPYAIVSGTPARLQRMRFSEALVERFLALEWWRYDLAPYKHAVDFSRVEETLGYFEARKAAGDLEPLRPGSYRLRRGADGFEVERLPESLFFPASMCAPEASTQTQAE